MQEYTKPAHVLRRLSPADIIAVAYRLHKVRFYAPRHLRDIVSSIFTPLSAYTTVQIYHKEHL